MSKISVTTIAGLTSGGDANTVKIESGDTLAVQTNATVGGTLGVTGASTLTGTTTIGNGTSGVAKINGGSSSSGQIIFMDAGTNRARIGVPTGTTTLSLSGSNTLTGDIVIDVDGRVTMPSQPSFQARSNVANINLSTYAGTTAALTTVFNAEYFDIGGHYNTTNSTFTAPVAGRYYFYTQLQLGGSPTTSDHSWGINLHFQVNSAGNYANGYHSLSTNQGGGSTTLFGQYGLAQKENILNLAANDTVRVAISGNANINAGTIETVTNDGRCRFGGHLLG